MLVGRYAGLTFVTEAEVPERPGGFLAREAWTGRFLAGAMLLGLGGAVPAFAAGIALPEFGGLAGLSGRSPFELVFVGIGTLLIGVVTLVCLLAGIAFLSEALAAMKPSNWVLRGGAEGLFIKLRRFNDHRLPPEDPIVAFVPRRELRWAGRKGF